MPPEKWQKVREIFAAVEEMEPSARAAYLRDSCGDEEIRDEIDRLLVQHETRGGILTNLDQTGWIFCRSESEPLFAAGEVLSERFRIDRYIGRGGMGEVYEAEDLELGGRVALKTLRAEIYADARNISRFKREIQLARRVTHPNVCRIFDVGHHVGADGRDYAFLTMELLEGETLAVHLKRCGPFSSKAALPVIRQLADGMQSLHDAGIVHRDLKPANIILKPQQDGQWRVVITDFGLARKDTHGDGAASGLSVPGILVGTPGYMAPEQLSGMPVGSAADIYAFGLVLKEMLGLTKGGPSRDSDQSADQPPGVPKSVSSSAAMVSEDSSWSEVVQSCLSVDPANRPVSARDAYRSLLETCQQVVPSPDSPWSTGGTVPPGNPAAEISARAYPNRFRIAVALALVLCVALWVAALRVSRQSGQSTAGKTSPTRMYVAILPFTVLGGDPGVRSFADGFMETVAQRLSQYQGMGTEFWVAPASEIRRIQNVSPGAARETLGVTHAVEGNFTAQGDRLRLTFSIVDARQARLLESSLVEGTRDNILALQDEVAMRLANMLDLRLQPEFAKDIGNLAPITPGAHEFYLQGLGYLQRNDRPQNVALAIDQFNRALALDSRHALSYAGLCQARLFQFEASRDAARVPAAEQACAEAIQLDPRLAQVHVTLGNLHNDSGRFDAAARDFQAALAIDHRSSYAFEGLGRTLDKQGKIAEAEAAYLKAVSLRPADWLAYKQLGLFYARHERYEEAVNQYRQIVALVPDNAHGYANLGAFLYKLGRLNEAHQAWSRALEIDPSRDSILSNLGHLEFRRERYKEAATYYRRAIEQNPNPHRYWGNLGAAYYWQSDPRTTEIYSTAIARARDDLQVNPTRTSIFSDLAEYYSAVRDSKQARYWLQRAIGASPHEPEKILQIAQVFEELGDRDAAIAWVERALKAGLRPNEIARHPSLRAIAHDHRYSRLLAGSGI